jgi:hypothetical protein
MKTREVDKQINISSWMFMIIFARIQRFHFISWSIIIDFIMMKKRVVSSENESNKRIKAMCISHEFLSRV